MFPLINSQNTRSGGISTHPDWLFHGEKHWIPFSNLYIYAFQVSKWAAYGRVALLSCSLLTSRFAASLLIQ